MTTIETTELKPISPIDFAKFTLCALNGVSEKQTEYATRRRAAALQIEIERINTRLDAMQSQCFPSAFPKVRAMAKAYKLGCLAAIIEVLKSVRIASTWLDHSQFGANVHFAGLEAEKQAAADWNAAKAE
jgi:hypothetical protein